MSGRQPKRQVDRHIFKIGIFTALTVEADLIERLFDQKYPKEDDTRDGDTETYSTGVIEGQNVVLVHTPYMGSNNAARVGAKMKIDFPGLEVIILVGLCGAVPFYKNKHMQRREEIWLGDLIISTAVIQFDYGRRETHGFRVKTGLEGLPRPNNLVTSNMNKLQTTLNRAELTKDLVSHLEALQKKYPEPPSYPAHQPDLLKCEKRCTDAGCGDEHHVLRTRPQNETFPSVHFGRFGSSNATLRSGLERDQLNKTHDIIAFEMESSGIREVCETIVIKAVCDYADYHKNKDWQSYAAAVAAAGLKAYLVQSRLGHKYQPPVKKVLRKSMLTAQFQSWDIISDNYKTAIVSPNFKLLAYGPEKAARKRDASILVHSLQNGRLIHKIVVKEETQVRSLAFNCKGKIIASAHGGYWRKPLLNSTKYVPVRIRAWNTETGRQQWLCEPHERSSLKSLLLTMAFDSKTERLAVVYSSNDRPSVEKPNFFIISAGTGQVVYKSTGEPYLYRMGCFSPNDDRLFVYTENEIAVLDTKDYTRVFARALIFDSDTAIFQPDGSLLVTYHNGDIETHFQERISRQRLDMGSDTGFDEGTTILRQSSTSNGRILVMTDSYSQQLCIASLESNDCKVLPTNGSVAKVLDISLDGQYLAWCEQRTSDSLSHVRVCNIQEELQTADISCFLENVD